MQMNGNLTYPLQMSFKVVSFGPQISVKDASGAEQLYVHMKALKLKEDINVYSDKSRSTQLFRIRADRIIDFSAEYHITDASEMKVGSIKREGMRSLWKASYNIIDPSGQVTHTISEDNAWVKVADGCLAQIPLVGIASPFLFHPSYTTHHAGAETGVMRITKLPALFEGKFSVELLDPGLNGSEQQRILLSNAMLLLLERWRG